MYAVERIGSYISKGVYTVSGPFHPFGGAVDIIVVEQEDGSFKSSPWYVRFGKFQGVLKTREKLVNISVNGVEANFHMYLDHKGETYFLREADVEEGETGLYSLSSGDEVDGKSQNNNRLPMKSKSCNFDANMSNSDSQVDMSNGKILSRTNSKRSRMLGLVFGRRSKKQEGYQEGEDGAGMARARAESLERAEIAADLLEVKWSTNLPFNKPRKANAGEHVQINDEKGQASSSVDYNVENSLDQFVLNEEIGSLNEQMGDSSLSSSENLESFVEETRIEVSCFSTPQEFTETIVAGESILEEECKVISRLSRKINVGDAKHNENAKDVISEVTCADSEVQFLVELEAHPEKHIGEEQIFHVRDVIPGCGISQEESGTDTVQSFIYCETSESLIVAMDGSGEETHETLYLASGGDGEVHVHAKMLHSTTELLPEVLEVLYQETVTLQVAEDGGLQTKLGEVPENPSHSCIDKGNVVDLEEPLTGPEFYTQMVTMDPTLEVESQNICTISNFSNSGHQVQDKKKKKDEITSKFQPSLETLGDCVPTEAVSSLPSLSLEEEQFLVSDLEEFKIGEDQCMESISPGQVDRESPSISPEGKEVNESVNERYGSYSSPKNFVQQIPLTDLDNSMEKSRITSSPILIPRSHKDSGEEVGQLVKSLPNLWSHTENPDAHDFYRPFSHSLNSSSKSLNPMLHRKDDSIHIQSDEDLQLAQEQPNVEDTQVSEPKGVLVNSAVGDPSKSSVASGGSWGLWPFSFRRSRSRKGIQPALKDARISDSENASESTICINGNKNELKPKAVKRMVRVITPTSEQLASLNLKEGRNIVTFTFSTAMLGKQQVDARIYLWKWNTRIVISDVDGTITKSDVLGQFMPLVGMDWSQTGVAHLFSAIKENGYQLLFLSARAISQAYHTRQFLFNLKQDGKVLPDGPVVISPDGLFPSLYREVIRRAPHEFKISCLEVIRSLFPSDCNPFYAGFGNRDTDEFSYLKVGIPKGKIFIINPKGEVAVNHRVDTKSYGSIHALVNGMFPPVTSSEQEDFNSWNYWKLPPTVTDI